MADFSKTVSDPQIQQPVPLQTNTGSLATDAIAAASFGLDLYRRSQTEAKNQAAMQKQADLSRATNEVIQNAESAVSQGVGGSKLEFGVINDINATATKYGLNPLDLRKTVAEFRGKTASQRLLEADKAEEKAQLDAQMNRRQDEEALASLAGYLPPSSVTGIQDITALSDEELSHKLLEASANKSLIDAQKSRLELRRANRTNNEEQRNIDVRVFSDSYTQQANAQVGQQIAQSLSQIDMNSPSLVTDGIRMASDLKVQLPSQVRAAANASGLNLKKAEVDQIVSEISGSLDRFTEILKRDDISGLNKNMIEEKMNDIFFQLETGSPAEQMALNSLLISKWVGTPPEISDFKRALATASKATLSDSYNSAYGKLTRDLQSQAGTPRQQEAAKQHLVKTIEGVFDPQVKDITPENQTTVTDAVVDNFSGSEKQIQSFISNSGYSAFLKGLAGDKAPLVLDSNRLEEVQQAVVPVVMNATASAISSFMRTRQRTLSPTLGAPERTGKAFDIDPNTLVISSHGVLTSQTSQSRKMNMYLQNTLKVLKNIGYSEQQIQAFKEDVLVSFGIVRTQENNNGQGE